MNFGNRTVLTMEAYFGESRRKFVLYSGDIIVMRSRFPFAVDLPIGDRGLGSRVLSWQVAPKADSSALPGIQAVQNKLSILENIEDIVACNKEAMEHYTKEMEEFSRDSGSVEDAEARMQRLRVTPRRYNEAEVYDHAKCNSSILPLDKNYFS